MERFATKELLAWRERRDRRPLLICGARQVGKTHLVESFGRAHFAHTLTLNFKQDPSFALLFAQPDPREIVRLIAVRTDVPVAPGQTLLFLDEVHAAPRILEKLRAFAQQMPDLHLIAAGSLLDLKLREHELSIPGGRIPCLHLHPLTLAEFVLASAGAAQLDHLRSLAPGAQVPLALAQQLAVLLREYLLVGGMPAVVRTWIETRSPSEVRRVQQDLLATIRSDLARYKWQAQRNRLRLVFAALPGMVGRKFMPVRVIQKWRGALVQEAFRLLCLAGLATPVRHTAANGIPLGAEGEEAPCNVCLLDVGLYTAMHELEAGSLLGAPDLMQVNDGQLVEQFVGQELRSARPFSAEPELFFWARERRTASAEVDFVIQHKTDILPVDVKGMATGHLRSLHMFLREKRRDLGVRFGDAQPSLRHEHTSLPDGQQVPYRLLSLPLYLAGELPRILDSLAR